MKYLAEYRYNGLSIRVVESKSLMSFHKGELCTLYRVVRSQLRPGAVHIGHTDYFRLSNAIRKFHKLIEESQEKVIMPRTWRKVRGTVTTSNILKEGK